MPEIRRAPYWGIGWSEAIQKLSPAAKYALEESLRALGRVLQDCRDPKLDRELLRWSPVTWAVPRKQVTHGEWIEYRLGDTENRGRAIVCYDREEDCIYLVARTPIHDLARLRDLTAQFQPDRPKPKPKKPP